MDWVFILTIVAAVVGVFAGIVQVVQYFQDRKKKLLEKETQTKTPADSPSAEHSLAASIKSIESEAGKKSLVFHNLPNTDYGQFVGREIETTKIHNILRPYPHSQHSIVTIDGIGGIGKSALALEVAYHYLRNTSLLSEEERFDAIIWASAKLTILTADGIKKRHQSHRTLKEIFSAIAITLQREDIIRAKDDKEQAEITRNALTKQRTLMIIDNLETIDDESIISFLQELPAPTKAIVTTRHRLDVAYPIRLTGLTWLDAKKLMSQECEKKNRSLDESDMYKLFERTGGVPLAIVWSVAQIGTGYEIESVLKKLENPQNDIARFCFDEIIQIIENKKSFHTLLAVSLFTKDADRHTIQEVTKMSDLDLDESLTELEKLSLVNKTKGVTSKTQLRYSLLPLTKFYVVYKFQTYPDIYKEYWRNLAKYYAQWSEERDRLVAGRSVESYREWRYERENFLAVIDQAYIQEEYKLFLDLILTASYFQFTLGYWEERNDYARKGIEVAQNIGDMNSYARLVHDIAYMENYEDDLINAQENCQKAQKVFRTLKDPDPWHLGSSLRLSGTISFKMGNLEKAKQDLLEGANIMQSIHSDRGYAIIIGVLASIAIAEGDFSKAREYLATVMKIAKDEDHFDSLSHCWMYLGDLDEAEGNLDKAEQAYRESLGYEERMERSPFQAHRMVKLATVLLKKGNRTEALSLAKKAFEMGEKVGMKKVTHDAKVIIEKLK